jgi:hypothetical protein
LVSLVALFLVRGGYMRTEQILHSKEGLLTHVAAADCFITLPHPALECGIVTAWWESFARSPEVDQNMADIHCHSCGGFVNDPGAVSYRLPPNPAHLAIPRSALCTCPSPIVYGPPPGYLSSPGMPSVDRRST